MQRFWMKLAVWLGKHAGVVAVIGLLVTLLFGFGITQLEFEAEVELEHGGTGTSLELDYEEFGEFEQEVSKGGEVALEEIKAPQLPPAATCRHEVFAPGLLA